MSILQTCTFFGVNCIIFQVYVIQGEPDWIVNERVSGYGEHLTLFCLIDDCCTQEAGWVKYDPDYETIYLDVRNSKYYTSTDKYAATTNSTGFSLTIKNIQKEDINIEYACVYGFDKSRKKVLLQSDVFRDEETRSGSELPIAGIVIGSLMGFVIILIAAVVFLLKLKQNRRRKKRYSSQNDDGVCVNLEKENKEKKLAHQTTNITDADILKTYEDSPKNDHDVCVNLLKEKEGRKRAHQTTNLTDCGADIIMVHPGDENKMTEWKP
ncbi:uncharacterized protein LOC143047284 [Mytilus galloprovincialis]|uniref:uncharacterized protein LOC143047284 n=1 Tax=Mytilus galloprovincialis TaxID=29158 RepID=UPI003F7CB087